MLSREELEKIFKVAELCKIRLGDISKNEEIKQILESEFLAEFSKELMVDVTEYPVISEDGGFIEGQIGCYHYTFARSAVLSINKELRTNYLFILYPFFDEKNITSKLISELSMKSLEYYMVNKTISEYGPRIVLVDGSIVRDIFRLKEILKSEETLSKILSIDIDPEKELFDLYIGLLEQDKIEDFPYLVSRYYYHQLFKFLDHLLKKNLLVFYFTKRPIGSTTLSELISEKYGKNIQFRDLEILSSIMGRKQFITKILDSRAQLSKEFIEKIEKILGSNGQWDIESIIGSLFKDNTMKYYSVYYRKSGGERIYKIEMPIIKAFEDPNKKSGLFRLINDMIMNRRFSNYEGYPNLLDLAHSQASIKKEIIPQIEVILWKTLK